MTETTVPVSPHWLRLREEADGQARSLELVRALPTGLGGHGPTVVHDLGCGNGSMGRWLGPRLAGPQHWVLHDRDAGLLRAAADAPPVPPDGASATVETRQGDITRLAPGDLAGASLVTASALLDLLTAAELERLVRSCVATGAPTLLTLSVTGRVRLTPADPLDAVLGSSFNAHQRRTTGRGALLGPDAVRRAIGLFEALGARVEVRPSPWRLDARRRGLVREWLEGWVGAAVEQRPELREASVPHLARRAAQLDAGSLRVDVHYLDVLAIPRGVEP